MERIPEARRSTVVTLTLLAPISWGTTYVTITELLPHGRPLLVASARVLPAGALLLVAGRLRSRWRPRGADWLQAAALATFNFAIFFPLLIVAIYRLPGGIAAVVGGTQPLLVLTLSSVLNHDRPRPRDVAVASAAAFGVGLIVLRPDPDIDALGVLAALGANASFATGVVLTKRFGMPSNRLASTGRQMLLGAAVLIPLTAIVEGLPPSMTLQNVAGFLYLSGVTTALAFMLWFDGIRRLPVAAPPLLGLAAPVTGAALGWVLLDESLSVTQLAGFAVTLSAIAYGAVVGAARHIEWRGTGGRPASALVECPRRNPIPAALPGRDGVERACPGR